MVSNSKPETLALCVHPFDASRNYKMIKSWWDARNFPAAQVEFLPPTGFVVAFKEQAVAAGFLFKTDAGIACIGHLVSNPDAPKTLRQASIDFLVEFLGNEAKDAGFARVVCSTNVEKLGRRFESLGFTRTDQGVSNYGRVL